MKEDSDRESEPEKWVKRIYRFVLDPILGCGVPVKISVRSDSQIKSYAPFRKACAYCIKTHYFEICTFTAYYNCSIVF
jgi:hypothetical protein